MVESIRDMLAALKAGEFSKFLNVFENDTLDAKRDPYVFETARQKQELAKDVSGMANRGGGIIIIGFRTARDPHTAGDQIVEVCGFRSGLVIEDQYYKVLSEWVYPVLDDVKVCLFPNGPDLFVAAIVIDSPEGSGARPYLVTKIVDDSEKVSGTLVGYFERKHDRVTALSTARLQQLLRTGMLGESTNDRLEALEAAVKALNVKDTKPHGGIDPNVVERRLVSAKGIAERMNAPIIYFSAAAKSECDFPTLFLSRGERVVRFIENPPKLRSDGFGLWVNGDSENIKGRVRRSVDKGSSLFELWKDGLLIFVGEGDEDLLAWASRPKVGDPISVNNFLLAELTLVFCWLVGLIFAEADPKPTSLRLTIGLQNMTRNGKPALLIDMPFGRPVFWGGPKPFPDPEVQFQQSANWDTYHPEAVAGALMMEIYNWCGFDAANVPYLEGDPAKPKLSAMKLTQKPLPTDVPTPGMY